MKSKQIPPPIADLIEIYQHGLQAVAGQSCVHDWLVQQQYAKKQPKVAVLAIGKAAQSMFDGAVQGLGKQIATALLISKSGHLATKQAPYVQALEAGHPIPDARSLVAGQAVLQFLQDLPTDMPLLCLVSGGSSALVEVLAEGLSLENWQDFNQYLLSQPFNIAEINRIRQHLSQIKAGRLANFVGKRSVDVLLISDVPGDDLSLIGSGLLVEHQAAQLAIDTVLPAPYAQWLQHAPALAKRHYFDSIHLHLLANGDKALRAMQTFVSKQQVHRHTAFIAGDALLAGREIGRYLRSAPKGIHLWHSETTVTLPKVHGKGGRCQSLALAAAEVLSGAEDCFLLAGASDGSDGISSASGAWVDGQTWAAGKQAQRHLEMADAAGFFQQLGQLLPAIPTGTNVMDLLIAVKLE